MWMLGQERWESSDLGNKYLEKGLLVQDREVPGQIGSRVEPSEAAGMGPLGLSTWSLGI